MARQTSRLVSHKVNEGEDLWEKSDDPGKIDQKYIEDFYDSQNFDSLYHEFENFFRGTVKTIQYTYTDLPVPEGVLPLMRDLLDQKFTLTLSTYSSVHKLLMSKQRIQKDEQNQIIKMVDDLQILFGLVKRVYGSNTLDYEIYDKAQSKLSEMKITMERNNINKAKRYSRYILDILETLVEAGKKVRDAEAENIVVQDTGEKIGGMRVFRPKK
jgi:hypothetical protein